MKKILEKIKKNQLFFYSIGILLLIIIISETFIFFYFFNKLKNTNKTESIIMEKEDQVIEKFIVDIKGEVNSPGTYEVTSDNRIIDVIKLAKGLTKNADTSVNNLSKYIADEMVINIYSKEEVKNFVAVKDKEQEVIKACNDKSVSSNNGCICNETYKKETEKNSNLVSINIASEEELISLPGIGSSKALAIIEYRKNNGLFTTIEDIKKVTGIGDLLYDQIKNYITI